VERLEEGFDLTTSNSASGYFHSGRGLGVSEVHKVGESFMFIIEVFPPKVYTSVAVP